MAICLYILVTERNYAWVLLKPYVINHILPPHLFYNVHGFKAYFVKPSSLSVKGLMCYAVIESEEAGASSYHFALGGYPCPSEPLSVYC